MNRERVEQHVWNKLELEIPTFGITLTIWANSAAHESDFTLGPYEHVYHILRYS